MSAEQEAGDSMRNLNEFMITDAVLDRVRQAPGARTRQISEALVRHLHAFTREVEPTQEEWGAGIDFLTAFPDDPVQFRAFGFRKNCCAAFDGGQTLLSVHFTKSMNICGHFRQFGRRQGL